jgi:hypothetical protein
MKSGVGLVGWFESGSLEKQKGGFFFLFLTFSPRKWRGGWLVGWLVLAVSVVLSIYMDLVAHAHAFVWVEEACMRLRFVDILRLYHLLIDAHEPFMFLRT